MWNASRFCVSSLRRGHANLLCIVPILVYVFRMEYIVVRFFCYIYTEGLAVDLLGITVAIPFSVFSIKRFQLLHLAQTNKVF